MDTFEKIAVALKAAGVEYQLYEHEPVFTSADAARIRDTKLHTGLKALVFFADGRPIMVTVPGDRKVDFKKFKELFSVKDLRMATPDEVKQVTSVPIGAVPPLGNIFGIPLYMDATTKENASVVFNAGLHTKSISLKEADYELVAKPIVGEYSQPIA